MPILLIIFSQIDYSLNKKFIFNTLLLILKLNFNYLTSKILNNILFFNQKTNALLSLLSLKLRKNTQITINQVNKIGKFQKKEKILLN